MIIILSFIITLTIGFVSIIRVIRSIDKRLFFANEFRDKFVQLTNTYYDSYDRFDRKGKLDNELYVWLTKNVNEIQSNMGTLGKMLYVAPFQTYTIRNYNIVINTLPKFRSGEIDEFDVNSSDDALLRHIGYLEDDLKILKSRLSNPIKWFQEGFKQLVSMPVYLLNWFGIISKSTTTNVIRNSIYKMIVGIGGLVTFISGIVTIFGQDQSFAWVKRLLLFFHIQM